MDKRIRRNELCVIGQPRCDFVFSSTRSCFVAYGFEESSMEVSLLKRVLGERGIIAEEAGGSLAPGQNAFCAKICSKIITSQFCIVLINNDERDGQEIPNANVNMEYGLMLGFNKHVIPFQKESQRLPFNVAGLDTVKYADANFERKAIEAIENAIQITQQDQAPVPSTDQILESFLLMKRALVASQDTEGDRALASLARPLGFVYLHDFSGAKLIYFGNFTAYRPEVVLWRLNTLRDIYSERLSTLEFRINAGIATPQQANFLRDIVATMEIWILVSSEEEKGRVEEGISGYPHTVQIFSMTDLSDELASLGSSE